MIVGRCLDFIQSKQSSRANQSLHARDVIQSPDAHATHADAARRATFRYDAATFGETRPPLCQVASAVEQHVPLTGRKERLELGVLALESCRRTARCHHVAPHVIVRKRIQKHRIPVTLSLCVFTEDGNFMYYMYLPCYKSGCVVVLGAIQ